MFTQKFKCKIGIHKFFLTKTTPSYLFHESMNRAITKTYTCIYCGKSKDINIQTEIL